MASSLRTDEILAREAEEILRRRETGNQSKFNQHGRSLYRKLNDCKFAALCLSGGGIRSAAFGLGVIQALATYPRSAAASTDSDPEIQKAAKNCLLAQFDYLSTVSGGGYIGSWLSAWSARRGFQRVWQYLIARPDGPDVEPGQIGWLRSYSNYLTPRTGLLSADAWSAASVYLCNLLLNWLIILPLFCCAIIVLKILAVGFDALMLAENFSGYKSWLGYPWFGNENLKCEDPINWQPYVLICGIPGVLLLIVALAFVTRNRILRGDPAAPSETSTTQTAFLLFALVPSVFSAILLAQLLGSDPIGRLLERLGPFGCDPVGQVGKWPARGIPVEAVEEAGPAKSAGIEVDDVIIKFAGKEVTTIDDLEKILPRIKFGQREPVRVELSHNGKYKRTDMQFEQAKEAPAPDRTPNLADLGFTLGHEAGLPVATVSEEGVAKAAGLEEKDVIVRFGGTAVMTSGDLEHILSKGNFSKDVQVVVNRKGRFLTITVTFEGDIPHLRDLGVTLEEGLRIAAVDEKGPARAAGIEAEDVILVFGGTEVMTVADLERALTTNKFDKDVNVIVNRKGKFQSIPVTIKADANAASIQDFGVTAARPERLQLRYEAPTIVGVGCAVGALIYVIGYFFGWIFDLKRDVSGVIGRMKSSYAAFIALIFDRKRPDFSGFIAWTKFKFAVFIAWTVSGCVYGGLLAFALYLFITLPGGAESETMFVDSPALPLTIGVPWILCSQLLSLFVFVGLTSYRPQSDADREWFGRAGGWILIAATGWSAMSFLTFGALLLLLRSGYVDPVLEFIKVSILPISGISGLATALLSKSDLTLHTPTGARKTALVKLANIGLAIAAPLFIAGFIVILSVSIDKILLGNLLFENFSMTSDDAINFGFAQSFETVWAQFLRPLFLGLLVFAAVGLCASYCININRFSLHAFYRNRLIRAFLGASRAREPDSFTGFDRRDDPKMHTIWPEATDVWQPFHVINMTLNLVSGKRLSWQERKAAPFTVSPLHCGTGSTSELSETEAGSAERPRGAYRPTTEYGGGISLGTAMAISGAAVSSNMGYHSSPAVTFLMSMLNVRLGWWLGNPAFERDQSYAKDGPTWAVVPLLQEALGLTTGERRYIYLSDGGHFENLGLYEMIRRRCRMILAIDAGCDPEFRFEDLGNAIRKISVDLDISIRFHHLERVTKRNDDGAVGVDHHYYVVGEIDYRAADGARENGIILYVKPGFHGDIKGVGIRGYAMANLDFPHQPTLDQWFSKSQFESYRALGFEIMDGILKQAIEDPACAKPPNLESIFGVLHGAGTEHSRPVEAASQDPGHSRALPDGV
jgi:S1-C subfamily serine protease